MAFPKTIEHSKQYLVNIQLFGDRLVESDPLKLNYLATSFDINYSGGSDFVHQKGRAIASAFATQPTITIRVRCLMTEPDFAVITSAVITEQQQILLSIGKIKESSVSQIIEKSALIFEAIGYMKDAQIIATVGEYISVDFSINADDINTIQTDDIPEFNQ